MRRQTAQPDRCRGRIEPADREDVVAQPAASADAIEHRLLGGAAVDLEGEQRGEERGDRDRPVLVRFDPLVTLVGDDGLTDLQVGEYSGAVDAAQPHRVGLPDEVAKSVDEVVAVESR